MKLFAIGLSLLLSIAASAQNTVKIRECVIHNGQLKQLEIDYDPATGDRTMLVEGVRKNFYDVYPKTGAEYASGLKWFTASDTVIYSGKPYTKYGLPRVLSVLEIQKTGVYKNIGVYVESGSTGRAEIIYIPVRQGCEFQPYQIACTTAYIEQTKASADVLEFKVTSSKTGKATYNWTSSHPILKGQGTSAISVSTKTRVPEEFVKLSVDGMVGKVCVIASDEIAIETESSTASLWKPEHKKEFMDNCIKNTKMEKDKATNYCNCMLEKIVKLYPNPQTVDKDLKQETIVPMARECLGIKP